MTHQIAEMTWQKYKDRVNETFLILPVGSTEQHAPHLPLGVDSIISHGFATRLAEETGALVAPVLSYGYKSHPASGGGPLFPGTVDLTGKTLIDLVTDLLTEFIADGWKKIFIMNGHFENSAFLSEASDSITRYNSSPGTKILISSWWDNISPHVMDKVFDKVEFPGWELEHAAIAETSMMLHFREDLVQMDKIVDEGMEQMPAYEVYPPPKELVKSSGSLHTAVSSTKEKGTLLVENVTENMKSFLDKEFK